MNEAMIKGIIKTFLTAKKIEELKGKFLQRLMEEKEKHPGKRIVCIVETNTDYTDVLCTLWRADNEDNTKEKYYSQKISELTPEDILKILK